jgi:ABC-type Zn uptake system ZnuABC Zn-binding protein ZnuA
MSMTKILAVMGLVLIAVQAHAALNVLASVPEWAALAQEIGGAQVKVSSATTALQDPHRIDAKPSLIARARNADLAQLSQLAPEIACFSEGAAREGAWIRGVRLESGCSGDRVSSQAARFAYNA